MSKMSWYHRKVRVFSGGAFRPPHVLLNWLVAIVCRLRTLRYTYTLWRERAAFSCLRGAVPSRREIIYPSDFYVCIAGGRAVGPLLCQRVAKNTEARADKSDCFRNNSFSEFLSNLFRGFQESSEGASRAKQKYLYPGRPSNWVINCRLHATISEWETKWSNCSQGNIIMSWPS